MIDGYQLVPSNGMKETMHGALGIAHGARAIPSYPPSPRGARLRDLRLSLRMGLREAAARLGLSTIEYSRLEYGAAVCDWKAAERSLRDEEWARG